MVYVSAVTGFDHDRRCSLKAFLLRLNNLNFFGSQGNAPEMDLNSYMCVVLFGREYHDFLICIDST